MRIYVGFDDTDHVDVHRGTGKLARWFEERLPGPCRMWGVVRQQLLVDDAVPYTSHNSCACAVVDAPDGFSVDRLVDLAVEHVERHFIQGSDPGICVARAGDGWFADLTRFGLECTRRLVTQKDAMKAAHGVHLSGHGGTEDGIIGAAAAVGLTARGWSGRFIEFGRLRAFHSETSVAQLEEHRIFVVSMDRDTKLPAPWDTVRTNGWVRPRLWGGRAILPVTPLEDGVWQSLGQKRQKKGKEDLSFLERACAV